MTSPTTPQGPQTVASTRWSLPRRILAAGAVVAFILVGWLSVIVTNSPTTGVPLGSPTEQQIASAMQALSRCIPTQGDGEDVCLTNAMTSAALRDGPGAVAVAVQRLVPRDPVIGAACHDSGHTMGRVLYETVETLDTLAAVDASCVGAYLHGIFDGFGNTNPEEAEYRKAAQVCNQLPLDRHELCFDGLGHSLWRTLQSPEAVSTVCGIAETDQGRFGCLAGIQMQKYAPKIGTATDDVTKAVETLAPFCAALPEWSHAKISGMPIAEPCLRGANYPFMVLYIGPRLYELSRGAIPTDPAVLADAYGKYLDACDSLRVDDSERIAEVVAFCRYQIGWTTLSTYPDRNGVIAQRVCTAFLRGTEQERCLILLDNMKRGS
jgi:hypothetical protein